MGVVREGGKVGKLGYAKECTTREIARRRWSRLEEMEKGLVVFI